MEENCDLKALPEESKYLNGKIYALTVKGFGEDYVGSTIDELNTRLSSHKCHYKNFMKKNRHKISKQFPQRWKLILQAKKILSKSYYYETMLMHK